MMKFKKFLSAAMTGVMLFGLVAAAVPAVSAYAEPEGEIVTTEVSTYDVAIDYETFTATISMLTDIPTDAYIILEVLKDETGAKVSAAYAYRVEQLAAKDTEAGTAAVYGTVVDLSFLKATKKNYIRVHGSSETVTSGVITIGAQPKKFSVKYTVGQGSLVGAFLINKAAPTEEELAAYEYRTLYGSTFAPLTELDQEMAETAGTTLLVRKAATETSPASAEIKVKIAAAPKAPKVTVSYEGGKIKLPKKTEYKVISGATQYPAETWIELGDTTTLTPYEILSNCGFVGPSFNAPEGTVTTEPLLLSGFSVAVRTKATGKKAASNITIIQIPPARRLKLDSETQTITVSDDENAVLVYEFTEEGTKLTAKGAAFLYTNGKKSVTLEDGDSVMVKATATTEILVLAAGNDKTGLWVSDTGYFIRYAAPGSDTGSGESSDAAETTGE